MLYREIIAVCSEIHTKSINTLCGQKVELLNVKLAVYIVTVSVRQTTQLMPYREMIVGCGENNTDAHCGKNAEWFNIR